VKSKMNEYDFTHFINSAVIMMQLDTQKVFVQCNYVSDKLM